MVVVDENVRSNDKSTKRGKTEKRLYGVRVRECERECENARAGGRGRDERGREKTDVLANDDDEDMN